MQAAQKCWWKWVELSIPRWVYTSTFSFQTTHEDLCWPCFLEAMPADHCTSISVCSCTVAYKVLIFENVPFHFLRFSLWGYLKNGILDSWTLNVLWGLTGIRSEKKTASFASHALKSPSNTLVALTSVPRVTDLARAAGNTEYENRRLYNKA